MSEAKEKVLKFMEENDLIIKSKFIPWRLSKRAGEKDPTLNWIVALQKGDKTIVETEYTHGYGLCPSYKPCVTRTIHDMEMIKHECNTGRSIMNGREIDPDPVDVLYSIVMDGEAINYNSFEDWASCFDFDEDSRKAERIYNTCLSFGIKLRNALGDEKLKEIQEIYSEY